MVRYWITHNSRISKCYHINELLEVIGINNMIADYLNIDLTEELDLDNLPREKKQQLVEKMTDVVTSRINNAFLNRLDEDQKEELNQLIQDDGDVLGFIKANIPNAEMIVSEIIGNFKQEAIELQKDIRQRVKAAK